MPRRIPSFQRALTLVISITALATTFAFAVGTSVSAEAATEARTLSAAPKTVPFEAVELPTLAAEEPVEAPAGPIVAGPDWAISISAVGLQAEVDQCMWVRMDFSAAVPVPVVAAHNYCGGGIILEMVAGQTVTLSGAGLDGSYVVGDGKDARADDYADEAVAGLSGDVILQTCYWSDDGALRLVGLHRVG